MYISDRMDKGALDKKDFGRLWLLITLAMGARAIQSTPI